MAKPFGIDITKTVDKTTVEKELKLIYDHLLNVWCSKNVEMYEHYCMHIRRPKS